jgi:predicted phage terminase large subunit-like protein
MSIDAQRAAAARELLRLDAATESFSGFVDLCEPNFKRQPFHDILIDALDLLEKGELTQNFHVKHKLPGWEIKAKLPVAKLNAPIRRLLINMPPRHAKSTYATKLFPAYYMARNGNRNVMSASYNDELSTEFGSATREYYTSKDVARAFSTVGIRADTRSKTNWKTVWGGSYFGVGLSGTTTGRPANCLIIDDPIRSRTEAESPSNRNKVWSYYVSSLENRKEPCGDEPPIEIVILTRWHPDDLGGRIIDSDDYQEGLWLHLSFPAINQVDSGKWKYDETTHKRIPLLIETALWEEQVPLDELIRRRRRDEREFACLYMQSPYIRGGNLIKDEWWSWYSELPDDIVLSILAADTAFSTRQTADYTVLMVLALTKDGNIYVLDLVRKRMDFPTLKRVCLQTATKWRKQALRAMYIENKASGLSLIQELRATSGLSVLSHQIVHDKVSRLQLVLPTIETGNVYLPLNAEWITEFTDECRQFPSSTHDDQVDALTIGLDVLTRQQLATQHHANDFDLGMSLNAQIGQGPRMRQGITPLGEL